MNLKVICFQRQDKLGGQREWSLLKALQRRTTNTILRCGLSSSHCFTTTKNYQQAQKAALLPNQYQGDVAIADKGSPRLSRKATLNKK